MDKKIRVMLDYICYPVWLYDEDEILIGAMLPEDLRDDVELVSRFEDLQARYDALFVDDGIRFEYVGFGSDEEKEPFIHDCQLAVSELIQKTDGKYEIVDEISNTFYTW